MSKGKRSQLKDSFFSALPLVEDVGAKPYFFLSLAHGLQMKGCWKSNKMNLIAIWTQKSNEVIDIIPDSQEGID